MKKASNFAKKSLGQNFLQNSNIRQQIIESAGNIKGKEILEIGPGLGFLTTELLNQSAQVTAVEIDERAVEILLRDLGHKENFKLIEGDILQQDLDEIFVHKSYSIIANIPYNITSPILRKILADTENKPQKTILMVQKEVAEKICNNKKRSILSISVEIYAEPKILFGVSKENFSPVPKVDSAVIEIVTRPEPLIPKMIEKEFFVVVNAGFSQKRKKLGNVFKSFFGIPTSRLLGKIDPNQRAETLSIDDWLEITKNFQEAKK